MKEIPLTKGKVALIDDDDYEYINQWRWKLSTSGYAIRTVCLKNDLGINRFTSLIMHRVIMNAKKSEVIDHVDCDRLNNTKNNLRFCSIGENCRNRVKTKKNTSGYKGVSWHKRDKRWIASIKINGIGVHLGSYIDVIEAANTYDKAAKKYFGKFAKTNNL